MKGAVEGLPTRALMDLPCPAGGPTFRGEAAFCGHRLHSGAGQRQPTMSRPKICRAMTHFWISLVPS